MQISRAELELTACAGATANGSATASIAPRATIFLI